MSKLFSSEVKKNVAVRLKSLRESRKLSHVGLSKELYVKYELKVSKDSLIKYEVSNELHSSFGATKGMALETLYCLADFYDVSIDYILGKAKIKSTDVQMQEVNEYTGLSEQSINLVLSYRNDDFNYLYKPLDLPPYINILNVLFEEKFMTELLKSFGRFLYLVVSESDIQMWDVYKSDVEDRIKKQAIWTLNKEVSDSIDSIIKTLIQELYSDYCERI